MNISMGGIHTARVIGPFCKRCSRADKIKNLVDMSDRHAFDMGRRCLLACGGAFGSIRGISVLTKRRDCSCGCRCLCKRHRGLCSPGIPRLNGNVVGRDGGSCSHGCTARK